MSSRTADEKRNMYGCTPCPQPGCGSKFRYVVKNPWPSTGSHDPQSTYTTKCDDCGAVDFTDEETLKAADLAP